MPSVIEFSTPQPAAEVTLRKALASDVGAIRKLMSEFPGTILNRSENEVRELISNFWVLEENREIVGCACLEVYGAKICEIRTVAVLPEKQGRGYGQRLVMAAVDEAKRMKIPQIMVITSEPRFFERLKFGYSLKEKYALFWNGDEA